MSVRPRTCYARTGQAHVAYQVTGSGPVDLVLTPGFISHLDLQWESVGYRRLVRQLASFARVIRYDKRGTGLSDPVAAVPTLEQRVDDLGAVLEAAGSNTPEWLLLEFGAALAGLTLVTVNPALGPRELRHVLGDSRAAGIFLVPEYRGASLQATLEEIRPGLPGLRHVVLLPQWRQFTSSADADVRLPQISPDAIAQIQYTSGTTGVPKGVLIRHRGLTNAARLWAHSLGARPAECWLNPNPLFHVSGSGS